MQTEQIAPSPVKLEEPAQQPGCSDKPAGRRKSRWKLKFHHQALPPEYLDHYEASVQAQAAAPATARHSACSSQNSAPIKYSDLPYMGEITLDNCKPRRGRKPKKADICHLIYKNYGTIVPDQPAEERQSAAQRSSDVHSRISSLLEKRLTQERRQRQQQQQQQQQEPLNLCVRDLLRAEQRMASSGAPLKRKRSAIFIPPMPSESSKSPATEVSICKFKFTGGATPSLQEKKSLSVDSGGNFRYYSGDRAGCLPAAPAPPACERPAGRGRSRKSAQRERLEQTFKEKGFLIQTQQLESAEGATYCKFRQLRKFTRYLFRSWKDYLPGSVAAPDSPLS